MVLHTRIGKTGACVPGHDDAYTDAVIPHLVTKGERDGIDSGFACGIKGLIRNGNRRGNRADKYNASSLLRPHIRQYGLRRVYLPEEVDIHDALHVCCLGKLNRTGNSHAGVGN